MHLRIAYTVIATCRGREANGASTKNEDIERRAAPPRSDLALPTIRAAKHIMESYFPATSEALGLSPKKKKPEPEPEPEKSAVTAYVLKLKEVMKNAYEKRTRREAPLANQPLQGRPPLVPPRREAAPSVSSFAAPPPRARPRGLARQACN